MSVLEDDMTSRQLNSIELSVLQTFMIPRCKRSDVMVIVYKMSTLKVLSNQQKSYGTPITIVLRLGVVVLNLSACLIYDTQN